MADFAYQNTDRMLNIRKVSLYKMSRVCGQLWMSNLSFQSSNSLTFALQSHAVLSPQCQYCQIHLSLQLSCGFL